MADPNGAVVAVVTRSHCCDSCLILGVGMGDGDAITRSGRWVSSGFRSFLAHENHANANICADDDLYNLCNLFRNNCKMNKQCLVWCLGGLLFVILLFNNKPVNICRNHNYYVDVHVRYEIATS